MEMGASSEIGVDSMGLTKLIFADRGSADSKGFRAILRGGIGANEGSGRSGMGCGGGGTVPARRWRFTRKCSWAAWACQCGLVTHRYFVRMESVEIASSRKIGKRPVCHDPPVTILQGKRKVKRKTHAQKSERGAPTSVLAVCVWAARRSEEATPKVFSRFRMRHPPPTGALKVCRYLKAGPPAVSARKLRKRPVCPPVSPVSVRG